MGAPWVPLVRKILDGEPINASTTNRPLHDLASRTEYLRDIINAINSGQGSYDFDAPLRNTVYEGAAVYWDAVNNEYALAIAELNYNEVGNYTDIATEAHVIGVCVGKTSTTRGVVCFGGKNVDIDFSESVGAAIDGGVYYLSATVPGNMTKDKPMVGIPVMMGLSNNGVDSGTVVVMPNWKNVLEDHVHYTFELNNTEGIFPEPWLPVTSGAPAGSVYYYDVTEDDKVNSLFPFNPAENVYAEIDGLGDVAERILIDNMGIWWMDSATDPGDYDKIRLFYASPKVSSESTVVREIVTDEDSAIQFEDCYGNTATAGYLKAVLKLDASDTDANLPGFRAFKEIQGTQFRKGPVVAGVRSNSLNVSYSTGNGVIDSNGFRAGYLQLEYVPADSTAREGSAVITALQNARKESYETSTAEIPYIALISGSGSRVTFRFDVSSVALGAGDYPFTFFAWVMGTTGTVGSPVTLPQTLFSYKIVANAGGTTKPSLETTEFSTEEALAYSPDGSVAANQYVRGTATPFNVSAGDQVYVQLRRIGSTDGYNGDVGILRAAYTLGV